MYSNHATELGAPPTIMFSRDPYEMVTDQILDEFCILKFKRFDCITGDIIGSVHKGIIVHEVEILFQGSEVKLVLMQLDYSTILCMAFPGTWKRTFFTSSWTHLTQVAN